MLSATAVALARSKTQQYKLWDERGLYLLIPPNGSRYWRLDYRFAGKRKTISLGVFPDVGLAVARDKRDEARRLLAIGENANGRPLLSAAVEAKPMRKPEIHSGLSGLRASSSSQFMKCVTAGLALAPGSVTA